MREYHEDPHINFVLTFAEKSDVRHFMSNPTKHLRLERNIAMSNITLFNHEGKITRY